MGILQSTEPMQYSPRLPSPIPEYNNQGFTFDVYLGKKSDHNAGVKGEVNTFGVQMPLLYIYSKAIDGEEHLEHISGRRLYAGYGPVTGVPSSYMYYLLGNEESKDLKWVGLSQRDLALGIGRWGRCDRIPTQPSPSLAKYY